MVAGGLVVEPLHVAGGFGVESLLVAGGLGIEPLFTAGGIGVEPLLAAGGPGVKPLLTTGVVSLLATGSLGVDPLLSRFQYMARSCLLNCEIWQQASHSTKTLYHISLTMVAVPNCIQSENWLDTPQNKTN